MDQIGSILREARIRRGLSLKEVSEITKVRVKYLEALEQNDFRVLPGPTYIKAYLRTYASVLRLDGDALVEDYRRSYERRRNAAGDQYDLTLEQVRSRSLGRRRKRPERNTRRGYALAGVVAILVVVLLAYFGSSRGLPEARIGALESDSESSTTVSVVQSTESTEPGASTTSSTESVYTGNNFWLRIRAVGDCFVMVRDDNENGTLLFRQTMRLDDEFNYTESKRYWVHIAQPESVRVFVKEVELTLPAEGGFFIITETSIERAD